MASTYLGISLIGPGDPNWLLIGKKWQAGLRDDSSGSGARTRQAGLEERGTSWNIVLTLPKVLSFQEKMIYFANLFESS